MTRQRQRQANCARAATTVRFWLTLILRDTAPASYRARLPRWSESPTRGISSLRFIRPFCGVSASSLTHHSISRFAKLPETANPNKSASYASRLASLGTYFYPLATNWSTSMTLGVRHVAVAITAILHALSGIILVSRDHPSFLLYHLSTTLGLL